MLGLLGTKCSVYLRDRHVPFGRPTVAQDMGCSQHYGAPSGCKLQAVLRHLIFFRVPKLGTTHMAAVESSWRIDAPSHGMASRVQRRRGLAVNPVLLCENLATMAKCNARYMPSLCLPISLFKRCTKSGTTKCITLSRICNVELR